MTQKATKKETNKNQEILGLLIMTFAVLIFFGLISYNPHDYPNSGSPEAITNWLGLAGAWVSYFLFVHTIGYACFVLPFIIFLFGWNVLLKRDLKPFFRLSLYLVAIGLFISTALAMPEVVAEDSSQFKFKLSGLVGAFIADILFQYLGPAGSVIVLVTVLLLLLMSATSWSMREALISLKDQVALLFQGIKKHRPKKKKPVQRKPDLKIHKEEPVQAKSTQHKQAVQAPVAPVAKPTIVPETQAQRPKIEISDPVQTMPVTPQAEPDLVPAAEGEFMLPELSLLDEVDESDREFDKDALEKRAYFLEEKLKEFDVRGEVVGVQPGPVITRFEVRPAPGVKINRFVGCQDDLSLAMKGQRVRVVAPIPGKAAVGIEIPNEKPAIVSLRKMLESKAFQKHKGPLPMVLGETIEGRPYVSDLTDMPHLLVAGATGSGKSVCLNTILISLLYKTKPSDMRLVLIDPKKLELNLYKKLRNHHLTTRENLNEEVITTPENAVAILRASEQEMERRYRILAHLGVRNIEDYNKTILERKPDDNSTLTKLPYLVVVVDELADLMVTGAREVEEPIARLAQMSRAVGIHLILATQRPSVDVITGVIKANFPSRIAFQVAQKNDSRTILDRNGAEKLLGRGDMLFLNPREQDAIRIHGAFVSTGEVNNVVRYVGKQPREGDYKLKGGAAKSGQKRGGRINGDRDELFMEAAKLVIRHQQGSASLLQRRLRVGYARAGRLIDELEDAGIIGPFDGAKAREVLVEESYINQLDQLEKSTEDEF